jgi:hypothetical protein
MIVPNQKVIVTWNNRLAKHYLNKGYKQLKPFEEFEINLEHLTDSSNQKVKVQCDVCGKVEYKSYNQVKESINHFCSKECHKSFVR